MPAGAIESRQLPCPNRCIDDLGSAFAMGCIGSTALHGFKGWRNASKGHRMLGGYQQIVLRAPAFGGNFAVWGGLFSAFDCGITSLRHKEDPLNAITSGFLTGGILALRAGWKPALTNACVGGALLGMIEGVMFLFGRSSTDPVLASNAAAPAPGTHFGTGPGMMSDATRITFQPRRTLTTALDEPTAQYTGLEPEDFSAFQSSSATRESPPPLPVYSGTEEFSSDDFTFNDNDDFEDEQQ